MQTNSASDLAVIVTRMRTVKQFGISSKTRLAQLCFKKDMFQKVKDVNFDFDEFVHFYARKIQQSPDWHIDPYISWSL